MKKILSAAQTREADQFTIKKEPIASIDLMERASIAFVNKFTDIYDSTHDVLVLAGSGNNGGDGLAVARLLSDLNYKVKTVMVRFGPSLSTDCQINYERLTTEMLEITEGKSFSSFGEVVIIDAIFGSGLNRPLEGWLADLINGVNESRSPVVSVDVPSGLMADEIHSDSVIMQAHHTITFQRPKLSFFLPKSGAFCGEVHVVDISLDEEFIEGQESQDYLLEPSDVQIPIRSKFAHKGSFGHLQVFAGSKGKIGAAHLAAKASLRSGVGLCTIHTAKCGLDVLQTNLPEAMVIDDKDENFISSGKIIPKVTAVCIGPGMGTHSDTVKWFSTFLEDLSMPAILDADAINILAQNQHLLDLLPKGTILTPHLGELGTIIGESANGLERIEKVKKLTRRYGVHVLIKGAHSSIVTSNGDVRFNSTGNPGMATAGSGDVLAGIIGSFLAQGLEPVEALTSAVYIHGLAGDMAKKEFGEVSIMASDLLNHLPKSISNVSIA